MKRFLEGTVYNRIEVIGGKEVNHLGFDDGGTGEFEKMLLSIAPNVGDRRKVRLSIELL